MLTEYQRPPLKWAGGKFRQLPTLIPLIGEIKGRYIEPFLGGGSVFLNVQAPFSVVSDANLDLVNFYRQVQADPRIGASWFNCGQNTEGNYNAIRAGFNGKQHPPATLAGWFLYLNKHGYNGLYRVNADGGYNVPWGKAERDPSYPSDAMWALHRRLQTAIVSSPFYTAKPYASTIDNATRGDFVYCDPPYVPLDKGGFTAYTSDGFEWSDQCLLARSVQAAFERGARCIVQNHDLPAVRQLYHSHGATHFATIKASRSINSDGGNRGEVDELIAIWGLP